MTWISWQDLVRRPGYLDHRFYSPPDININFTAKPLILPRWGGGGLKNWIIIDGTKLLAEKSKDKKVGGEEYCLLDVADMEQFSIVDHQHRNQNEQRRR